MWWWLCVGKIWCVVLCLLSCVENVGVRKVGRSRFRFGTCEDPSLFYFAKVEGNFWSRSNTTARRGTSLERVPFTFAVLTCWPSINFLHSIAAKRYLEWPLRQASNAHRISCRISSDCGRTFREHAVNFTPPIEHIGSIEELQHSNVWIYDFMSTLDKARLL